MALTQFQTDSKIIVLIFWNAGQLLKKLPKPPNKFTLNTVFQHYKSIIQTDYFNLATLSENTILNILKNTNVSKAAGLYNLYGRFLKDGAEVFAKHITDLCNLSIISRKFPDSGKIAELKPIYKKGSLTEASNYRPISLLPLTSKVIEKVIHDQASHQSRKLFTIISQLKKFTIQLSIWFLQKSFL